MLEHLAGEAFATPHMVKVRIAAATIERLCMRAFLGLYLSKPFETIKQPLNLN
tara:strand:- start:212 stop:370 length:159 start_codon:yes stop_codon:yes gene_type:complete